MRRLLIDNQHAQQRLDVFIAQNMPALSRAFVQKLIEDERILVNKVAEKPGYKLRLGDKIEIDFTEKELEMIPDIELLIIYEDNDVLVVNKPVGVISHARGRFWNEASVASFVRQKTGQQGERAGIVHRLDRATSGVMICAKNQETLSWLQKQFSTRKVKKTYYAIVAGTLEPEAAVIDMPIGRNPREPQKFSVRPDGRPALTKYETVKTNDSYTLVKLTPETGRTHQLRVHLKKIGHPIAGDVLYDGKEADRLYLHAESLEITLPNKERKVFEAPLPTSFNRLVKYK
jgi:23S rRNA pseudouridine1911/1915/1917 synthase